MGKTKGWLATLLGLAVTLGSGWYITRGPFFGFHTPPPERLLAACGVFILAMYIFAWGLDGLYRSRKGDRVQPDEEQNQTLDMGFGPR